MAETPKFKVADPTTGETPDLAEVALHEEWAKDLMYCDMEGFALCEDGALILMDECGNYRCAPPGRFSITSDEPRETGLVADLRSQLAAKGEALAACEKERASARETCRILGSLPSDLQTITHLAECLRAEGQKLADALESLLAAWRTRDPSICPDDLTFAEHIRLAEPAVEALAAWGMVAMGFERHEPPSEVERLRAQVARLEDDELAEKVARDCQDTRHDDRSCSTCDARDNGIEEYRAAVRGKPERGEEHADDAKP